MTVEETRKWVEARRINRQLELANRAHQTVNQRIDWFQENQVSIKYNHADTTFELAGGAEEIAQYRVGAWGRRIAFELGKINRAYSEELATLDWFQESQISTRLNDAGTAYELVPDEA